MYQMETENERFLEQFVEFCLFVSGYILICRKISGCSINEGKYPILPGPIFE